jgi:modulator of FtsH protease HflC
MNKIIYILSVVVFVVLTFNPFYMINEYEKGLLLQFSAVKKSDIGPGLHIKIPVIQKIKKFDTRILTIDTKPERYLTINNRKLIVDNFAQWKIIDVEKFYTAAGSESNVQLKLARRINDGLREQFGKRTVREVISEQREDLMDSLVSKLGEGMEKDFGIKLVDVRVKRIDLPKEVNESVYLRMNADRNRLAQQKRSEGQEKAEGRRAEADREKVGLLAQAYKNAEKIRGEGDAQAAATYAQVYKKDPEFHTFIRSLQTYKSSFSSKEDIMLLDSKGDFFNYMKKKK